MTGSRQAERSHGWVDLVARTFVGLWAGSILGLAVGVVACVVVFATNLHHELGWFWFFDVFVAAYAVTIPVVAVWFLLDFPVPWFPVPWPRRSRRAAAGSPAKPVADSPGDAESGRREPPL